GDSASEKYTGHIQPGNAAKNRRERKAIRVKTRARVFERCPNCDKKTFRASDRSRAGVGQRWFHQDGTCRDADCRYSGWRHVIDNRRNTFWWTRGKPSCNCAE